MAKLTLENIVPLKEYEKLAESASEIASLDESKLVLLTQFLDENKEKLEHDIDISKIYDSRIKNEVQFYDKKGILLSSLETNFRPQMSFMDSLSSHSSSSKENEVFYVPSEKDFLKIEKSCFHYYSSFYSFETKETTACEKPERAEVIKAVNLVKLARILQEFLSPENKEKGDFSKFYKNSWFREFERRANKR
ncbi:MAG: hypothetical protein V1886_02065 [archaeon]